MVTSSMAMSPSIPEPRTPSMTICHRDRKWNDTADFLFHSKSWSRSSSRRPQTWLVPGRLRPGGRPPWLVSTGSPGSRSESRPRCRSPADLSDAGTRWELLQTKQSRQDQPVGSDWDKLGLFTDPNDDETRQKRVPLSSPNWYQCVHTATHRCVSRTCGSRRRGSRWGCWWPRKRRSFWSWCWRWETAAGLYPPPASASTSRCTCRNLGDREGQRSEPRPYLKMDQPVTSSA